MTEQEQLAAAWARLGVNRPQAEMMAAQLWKRAGQLATERGVTREEALAYLLKLVAQGRAGETPTVTTPLRSPHSK